MSLYYRGTILNRLGRYEQAQTSLDAALNERQDLILARQEKGESLWQLGRKDEAVAVWTDAVQRNPNIPLANNELAGAMQSQGQFEKGFAYEKQADEATPDDPLFHWMLGLRLKNLGMTELAGKHFQRAIQLDPEYQSRPNPSASFFEVPQLQRAALDPDQSRKGAFQSAPAAWKAPLLERERPDASFSTKPLAFRPCQAAAASARLSCHRDRGGRRRVSRSSDRLRVFEVCPLLSNRTPQLFLGPHRDHLPSARRAPIRRSPHGRGSNASICGAEDLQQFDLGCP